MDCIFCKIINDEIPSHTIYENDYVKVIMDIFPISDGHILIIPKKHYARLSDMDNNQLLELMNVVQKLHLVVEETLKCDGIHILENYGNVQEVPHVHFHIIPTYKNSRALSLNKLGDTSIITEIANNIKMKI